MRWVALAATLALTLAACGGGAEHGATADATSSSLSSSAVPAASLTTTYTVPDVTGDLLRDGVLELYDFGVPKITLGDSEKIAEWIGADEISDANDLSITSGDPDQEVIDGYVIYKTEPAAGTTLETIDSIAVYLKAELPPEAKISAWQAACLDIGGDEKFPPVYTLDDVWELTNRSDSIGCDFALQPGKTFKPTKEQAAAIQVANEGDKDWRGNDNGFSLYAEMLEYCVEYTPSDGWGAGDLHKVKAAAMICPDSPYYDDLDAWGNGKKFEFEDGTYVVGKDLPAGTYKTMGSASDCYWERATPNGSIIANDFITYAAQGAIVTVRKGESFISKECGPWEK